MKVIGHYIAIVSIVLSIVVLADTEGNAICGDGFLDPGEQCDDGNVSSGDSCCANCTLPPCDCRSLIDPHLATPSAALVAAFPCGLDIGAVPGEGAAPANTRFCHTFVVPPNICGATLKVTARPTSDASGALAKNDNLNLGFIDGSSSFAFGQRFNKLPEAVSANLKWVKGDPETMFLLDLGNLPGGGSLLDDLNSNNFLDILTGDDTGVLDLVLTTTCCGCEKVYFGGTNDDFQKPSEPASPDADLTQFIQAKSVPGVPLNFDEIPGVDSTPLDSWFGHTFQDLGVICGATLEIRAKPGPSTLANNDRLTLVDKGRTGTGGLIPGWKVPISSLPEAGGQWPGGGPAVTFTLDLANLPPDEVTGLTNILDLVNDKGELDVFIQDDTGVDFMILTTTCCPHFKCYKVKGAKKVSTRRTLEDQFETKVTDVKRPFLLCNPTDKGGEDENFNERNHLVCYKIKDARTDPKQSRFESRDVEVENQFGVQRLTVSKPNVLCVPSAKRQFCVGGTNDGAPCISQGDCPGGTCGPP
ncbi:MAG: hypothetical protein ACE5I7_00010 [Candidatus Binatia bacterium]